MTEKPYGHTRVLITGSSGQDASWLALKLLNEGCKVYGLDIVPDVWRLRELAIDEQVEIVAADISDLSSLIRALEYTEADEIYHLAGQSFVGSSFDHPIAAGMITGLGTVNILEAVRITNPGCRVYNAATSELFGDNAAEPQSEETPMRPSSPYAIAKWMGYQMVRLYRECYGLFACSGILFNHEGIMRGEEFVTRKISMAVARIACGLQDTLRLGNINAYRDWGDAREYVDAMVLMLRNEEPKDYVVATGTKHSVMEFCELAFDCVGLDWKDYVDTDQRYMRPQDVCSLRGDASLIKEELGWSSKTTFSDLVRSMVEMDLKRTKLRMQMSLNGYLPKDLVATPRRSATPT